MRYLILMGSPRKNGNTASLLKPFLQGLTDGGAEHEMVWLYDRTVHPCTACRACQTDWSRFGCQYNDDMQTIFDKVLACDVIVLATPIYSWYCTPPMKAMLDRLVYGMNKYYGDKKGPALWAGKKLALLVTCGYRPEKGADLFEAGMIRYSKHSQLTYAGMLCERDLGYDHDFMNSSKAEHARVFAKKLLLE
ncbi:MAG: flavodoxin family protein [Candidatus Fimivivens sp.]|nr:flavodoxin family protein [Candidatus Fimivivens sp.]